LIASSDCRKMDTKIVPGVNICNILEKVDLFTFDPEEVEPKADTTLNRFLNDNANDQEKFFINAADPTAAYLGPKLWSNPISLEDLMKEEDISDQSVVSMSEVFSGTNLVPMTPGVEQKGPSEVKQAKRPSIIVKPHGIKKEPNAPVETNKFLYVESKRARLDREKEERKRKLEVKLSFSPEEIALATVPGIEFDPKTNAFDLDDLRPQPIVKKRKKIVVPEEMKDEKYWEKREKNKEATRRSREAKRLKENQIVMRAAYLEQENKMLKQELESSNTRNKKMEIELEILKRKLQMHEPQIL